MRRSPSASAVSTQAGGNGEGEGGGRSEGGGSAEGGVIFCSCIGIGRPGARAMEADGAGVLGVEREAAAGAAAGAALGASWEAAGASVEKWTRRTPRSACCHRDLAFFFVGGGAGRAEGSNP